MAFSMRVHRIHKAGACLALMAALFSRNAVTANPVGDFGCADPGIYKAGATYCVVQTSGSGNRETGAMPIICTADPANWSRSSRKNWVFPGNDLSCWPQWRKPGTPFWAPQVACISGRYVCYFACKRAAGGWFSIGAATSSSPTGPFKDKGSPLETAGYGLIDPYYFKDDDGKLYLLWKEDLNGVGQATTYIVLQQLSADGLDSVGECKRIMASSLGWEGGIVEAPALRKRAGQYFLFYSGGRYSSATNHPYVEGVARASNIWGPYAKKKKPILQQTNCWGCPGGGSFVPNESDTDIMFYHAYRRDSNGKIYGNRLLMRDRVYWDSDGWPFFNNGVPSE